MKPIILALALFTLTLLPALAFPPPADWSQNEWYQFFEQAVTTSVAEAPGAALKAAEGVSAAPIMDVYTALSGIGSSVKPGMVMWLRNKRVQAELDGDTQKANKYQAYETAIATGDNSRLQELLNEYGAKRDQTMGNSDTPTTQVQLPSVPGYGQMSQHPFNGTWKTTWGTISITVNDDGSAKGTYSYLSSSKNTVTGTLAGQVTGYVFDVARWTEQCKDEKASGKATLTITADGTYFSGPWLTQTGDTFVRSGEWKGDKVK